MVKYLKSISIGGAIGRYNAIAPFRIWWKTWKEVRIPRYKAAWRYAMEQPHESTIVNTELWDRTFESYLEKNKDKLGYARMKKNGN